ncbi:MAG: UDP-N-acetylmuramate dehydrogenase [Parcubacteria group bacterium]|nr:UDP-N-acetylmuramate dehydrogenase [Parcubacteria group bacterium]
MATISKVIKADLEKIFGEKVVFNHPLSKITTLGIGGGAQYFISAQHKEDIIRAIHFAKKHFIPHYLIGGASNIVANDKGIFGIVIQNSLQTLQINAEKQICYVGAGHPLLSLVHALNRHGLSGMEKMAGIPGTIGGAIYGCAGAYGQEIKNCLERVKIFDGEKTRWITKSQCRFGYRTSIFKQRKNRIILEAEFQFTSADPKSLKKISRDIIKIRAKKYPPDLKCPGSFFKNIVIDAIRPVALKKQFLSKIDLQKINHGKLASGYLLEQIGAKGQKRGDIAVAEYHGNLIYNTGNGKSKDVKKLANLLKKKVQKKFGIILEEEIQYL